MRASLVLLAAALIGCGVDFRGTQDPTGGVGGSITSGSTGGAGGSSVGGSSTGGNGGAGTGGEGGKLEGWAYRKSLTVQASQVEATNAALADYPLMVAIVDTDLQTNATASGGDIRFTTPNGSPLDFELEAYQDGQLFAWVRIPSLSSATDTSLVMLYGNPNAEPASDGAATFGPGFELVWHLDGGPNDDAKDVTENGHDGVPKGDLAEAASVPGFIHRGVELDGGDDYFDAGGIDFGDSFTISAWVRPHAPVAFNVLVANRDGNGNENGFNWGTWPNARLDFNVGNGNAQNNAPGIDNTLVTSQWHYVVLVANRASASAASYIDGVEQTANNATLGDYQVSSNVHVGALTDASANFDGVIDELRVSKQLRTPEWIRTSHRNYTVPHQFVIFGAQEVNR
jgi:Concanavalin A-like lectin/glucanases superfamily/Domain of unknown function (DUF2341)